MFYASKCMVGYVHGWAKTADGARHDIRVTGPLFNTVTKVRIDEVERDGRGLWITIVGRMKDGEFTYERDWMRRTYWHDLKSDDPKAMFQPPQDPSLIRPTDIAWHRELVKWGSRSVEHQPAWVQKIQQPPNPLDPNRPMPQYLVEAMAQPPADHWVEEISRQLLKCTKGMGYDLEAFQADPESIEGDSIRGMVMENVPLEVIDELWKRDVGELPVVWPAFTGKPWPAGLPHPPLGTSIESLNIAPDSEPRRIRPDGRVGAQVAGASAEAGPLCRTFCGHIVLWANVRGLGRGARGELSLEGAFSRCSKSDDMGYRFNARAVRNRK